MLWPDGVSDEIIIGGYPMYGIFKSKTPSVAKKRVKDYKKQGYDAVVKPYKGLYLVYRTLYQISGGPVVAPIDDVRF